MKWFVLSGKKSAEANASDSLQMNSNSDSFLERKDSFTESSRLMSLAAAPTPETRTRATSSSNSSNIIEKESTSYNFEDSLLNRTYSTTLNTQVKSSNAVTNGFKEESFLIKPADNPSLGNSFRLEREPKAYFGSKTSTSSQNSPMMDELSKNPLFNRDIRSRSKSPMASSPEKSPIVPR